MKTINSPTDKNQKTDEHGFDIPILQERCDSDPQKSALSNSTSNTAGVKYPSDNRSNPFLPYDTLEKLAAERVQFQQQLAEFDHYFNEKERAGKKLSNSLKATSLSPQPKKQSEEIAEIKTESIRQLVQTMTQAVMAEYAAEIEMEVFRRVKTKLLGSNESGSKD
ncbi:MAG: hypothetical protein H7A01_04300 [Hahellaceae bacterium]|jgi:hypothetical protein|nr:hypothetical protein [Hahellaceae bacterium]MCP5213226.1 hypothetical protein [Hahellaceae bacterium]